MRSPLLGEFMGTMVLILLGDGVVAGVLLKRSKAENSGWIVITAGWCFAVLCGIFTAILFGSKAADINPAFALAGAVQTGAWSTVIPYTLAETAGAFAGAILVWLHYWPHWKLTEDPEAKRAIFCTTPAMRHRAANFFSEVLGTFILVLVVGEEGVGGLLKAGQVAGDAGEAAMGGFGCMSACRWRSYTRVKWCGEQARSE